MAENKQTPTDPDDYTPDTLDGYMRMRVMKLFREQDLTVVEKNAINQLAGTLALQSGEEDKASARIEYLLCFLEGEIDWRKRYEQVFKLKPPTKMAPENKTPRTNPDGKKKTPKNFEDTDV